jgi:hypothetical protein
MQTARHWLALPELRLPLAPAGGTIWRTPHLAVSIRSDFAVTETNGDVLLVKPWLKEQVLTRDAVRGCLRLLDRHMAQLSPGGTATVVDVRREKSTGSAGGRSKAASTHTWNPRRRQWLLCCSD